MFIKESEEQIKEVIEQEVIHNIPALKAKRDTLLAELAEIDKILLEDSKFVKEEGDSIWSVPVVEVPSKK